MEEKGHRGFAHQTIRGASRRAGGRKKGIIIVYTAKVSVLSSQSGGTEGGIIRQGFLPLFKDVLIISPLCGAARDAGEASSCAGNAIKED